MLFCLYIFNVLNLLKDITYSDIIYCFLRSYSILTLYLCTNLLIYAVHFSDNISINTILILRNTETKVHTVVCFQVC